MVAVRIVGLWVEFLKAVCEGGLKVLTESLKS